MQDLVIVGAGGFAREVAFLVNDINRSKPAWNLLGYIDFEESSIGKTLGEYAIVGTDEFIRSSEKEINVVVGIGAPALIWRIVQNLSENPRIRFPNLVHPTVVGDFDRIRLGAGNIICAGNIFTTDIQVGSFNIINLTCTVGHDAIIGDANVVNPGVNISGGVTIHNRCLIGTGARILQNKTIGEEAVVGAGAVVSKDVAPHTTVVGVPAKPIDKR